MWGRDLTSIQGMASLDPRNPLTCLTGFLGYPLSGSVFTHPKPQPWPSPHQLHLRGGGPRRSRRRPRGRHAHPITWGDVEVLAGRAQRIAPDRPPGPGALFLLVCAIVSTDSQMQAATAQGSSPAVQASVFSSSLEDEQNWAGVAIRRFQKVNGGSCGGRMNGSQACIAEWPLEWQGVPAKPLVGSLTFWNIGVDAIMLSRAEMEMLTAIAMCSSLGQCKTCQDGRDEGGG
ncbi:uncharacterized protein [Saccopteryx bilineata]|uniref:uncharacterized protein n=1 Tax=Saccopteryx bilineata TaxID=59482 RepID=UPI00338EB4CB